jgi:hypothetical protein
MYIIEYIPEKYVYKLITEQSDFNWRPAGMCLQLTLLFTSHESPVVIEAWSCVYIVFV